MSRSAGPSRPICRQRSSSARLRVFLTFLVGVPLGVYAGYWKDSPLDKGARIFAVLGQSAPPFWVGIILIMIFSIHLGWLPAGTRGGIEHLILPASTMAWASIAGVTRLIRSNLLETLDTDYIRFCRIKGQSETNILWKHGLRNAGIPVMTFSAVITASLITGSVITETIFTWPGLGKLLIDFDRISRSAGDPGLRPDFRGGLYRPQPDRRSALRLSQSQGEGRLMSTQAAPQGSGMLASVRYMLDGFWGLPLSVKLCLVLFATLLLSAVFAPLLVDHSPTYQDLIRRMRPPAWVEGGSTDNLPARTDLAETC